MEQWWMISSQQSKNKKKTWHRNWSSYSCNALQGFQWYFYILSQFFMHCIILKWGQSVNRRKKNRSIMFIIMGADVLNVMKVKMGSATVRRKKKLPKRVFIKWKERKKNRIGNATRNIWKGIKQKTHIKYFAQG